MGLGCKNGERDAALTGAGRHALLSCSSSLEAVMEAHFCICAEAGLSFIYIHNCLFMAQGVAHTQRPPLPLQGPAGSRRLPGSASYRGFPFNHDQHWVSLCFQSSHLQLSSVLIKAAF